MQNVVGEMEGDAPSCRDACTWHGEPKNDTAERDAQRDPDEDAENSKVVVLPRISANAEGKLDEKELENRSISDAEKEEKEVVSKNQLKRRRRFEKALVRNEKRKTLKKETRRAKAIAAGRDLEQEMRIQIERTESGEGRRRRDAVSS